MLASLILYTVVIPLAAGLGAALLSRTAAAGRVAPVALFAVAGATVLWLIEGVPAVPPTAAKHKLLILAAAVGPLAVLAELFLASARSRAWALFVFTGFALFWLGGSRLTDPALLPRFSAVALFLALAALAFARFERTEGNAFAGVSTLLVTEIGLALTALLSAHIGGGQLGGALAAVTGGWALVAYGAIVLGKSEAVALPDMALWAGLALTSLVLIQSGLFAPSTSLVAVVLLALPLLAATVWPRPLSTNPLVAPVLSGAFAALAATAAVVVAAL